jgi:hypothetical protein
VMAIWMDGWEQVGDEFTLGMKTLHKVTTWAGVRIKSHP